MNESAIYAARDKRTIISQEDVDNAYEKVTLGLPKTGEISEDRNELVAYHEAGHAIMGVLCQQRVGKVTIIPRGNAGGFTQFIPDEDNDLPTREAMLGRLKVAMGGRAAEEIVYGKSMITSGAQGDLQQATQLAYQMVEQFGFGASVGPMAVVDDCSQAQKALVDEEVQSILSGIYQEVVQDLWCFRGQLEEVKEMLVSYGTIRGDAVEGLVMKAVPIE